MALAKERLPRHVAIIMDGNGRWARSRALPRIEGHIAGIESVRDIVTANRAFGIPVLTLYAFSKENWTRPQGEVQGLMELLGVYLEKELPLMMENDISFRSIGAIEDLSLDLQEQLQGVVEATQRNSSMVLNLAISYSGREEILRATRQIVRDLSARKIMNIDEDVFSSYLYTADIPDPDLLIRTSGEMRLSNFLLWQLAYTEIYVTSTLWPDFRREDYKKALEDFAGRERRFGGTVKDEV
jgi:undecaprenyl diphosphate synthase